MSAAETASPQATEPASGLDAIISGAIESSGYGKEDVAAPVAPEAPAETTIPEPKVDATGRAHAPDGKFASKKSAEPEPSVKEPAPGEAKPAETVAAETPKGEPIQPPARWSDADKAEFAKLPPEAQQLLLARHNAMDGDYTRKTQAIAETQKSIEPLLGEVKRLEPLFQQWQTTPQDFMQRSVNVVASLTSPNPQERVNTVANLVNHYKVPLAGLLQTLGIPIPQVGENGQPQPVDPTVLQLRQQITGLEQSVQRMNQQNELSQVQRFEHSLDTFGQSKDNNGQPKYPHFQQVRQSMLRLIGSEQAADFDQAYTKAVRLDDELYKGVVESERKRVADDAEKARLEAVEKAKKTQPVKSSSAPPGGGTQMKGLDAHLSAALEKHGFSD